MTKQEVPFTQCPTFAPAESEHYYRPAVFPEVTIPNWVIDMCRASGSVPYGWHIVEVLDRRVHDTTDDVARQKALMAIRTGKLEEETELWVRRIRDESFVEYRL